MNDFFTDQNDAKQYFFFCLFVYLFCYYCLILIYVFFSLISGGLFLHNCLCVCLSLLFLSLFISFVRKCFRFKEFLLSGYIFQFNVFLYYHSFVFNYHHFFVFFLINNKSSHLFQLTVDYKFMIQYIFIVIYLQRLSFVIWDLFFLFFFLIPLLCALFSLSLLIRILKNVIHSIVKNSRSFFTAIVPWMEVLYRSKSIKPNVIEGK